MEERHPVPIDSEDHLILEEAVRIAYSQTGRAVVGGSFLAAIAVWIFAGVADHRLLFGWLGTVVGLSAVRGVVYLAYRRSGSGRDPHVWLRRFVVATFLAGSAWGAAWWLLLPVPGHPEYTLIVMVFILGISASSVSAYTINLPALFAFFVPVTAPGIPRLFLLGGTMDIGAAVALTLYCYIVLTAMLPIHRSMIQAIRLNHENAREIAERKRMEALLRELSTTDGLTGLATRRHFDEVLDDELDRASRTHSPIALILADIDCFKLINDTQGHVEGDNCLKQVAPVIKETGKRPGDLAARYGGEEFAVILANTGLGQAGRMAETLRERVQGLQLPHNETLVKNCSTVTISVGVASIVPSAQTTAAELISQADEALYRAKEGGRNRVEANCEG